MGARKNADIHFLIIEKASALFALKSVAGTGLAEIAGECEISKGTLYYYFPNKERLVCACAETLFGKINDALFAWMRSAAPDMPFSEICLGLASVFVSDKQSARLIISLVSCASEKVKQRGEAAFEQWRIMLELAALRMNENYGKRFERLAKTLLPLLIGFCALGADAEEAGKHILSLFE